MLALDRSLLVPGFQGIMVCLDMIGLGLASHALPPPINDTGVGYTL